MPCEIKVRVLTFSMMTQGTGVPELLALRSKRNTSCTRLLCSPSKPSCFPTRLMSMHGKPAASISVSCKPCNAQPQYVGSLCYMMNKNETKSARFTFGSSFSVQTSVSSLTPGKFFFRT